MLRTAALAKRPPQVPISGAMPRPGPPIGIPGAPGLPLGLPPHPGIPLPHEYGMQGHGYSGIPPTLPGPGFASLVTPRVLPGQPPSGSLHVHGASNYSA